MPSPGAQGPSPSHMYFPYLPGSVDGPAQQLAQAQLPPHTTTPHQLLTVSPELTAWSRLTQTNYHHPPSVQQAAYPASLQLDALGAAPSRAYDSLAAMGAMDMVGMDETMGPTTSANRRLPSEGIATHHFHSTLQPQRRSPQNMQPHRTQTLASDLSRDQTAMMLQQAHAPVADQRMLQYTQQQANTNTAATLGPNLDGSPSWSSAMNPMGMSPDQYDQYYHYQQAQAQRQQQQQHANAARHQPSRGPPPLDSSQAHHNSHSSTAISHQSRQQAQTTSPVGTNTGTHNLTAAQAQRYSLELRRQQEEQLRKLRWQHEEEQRHRQEEQDREREEYVRDQARRRSEEEAYLQRLAQAYGNSASPHPLEAQHASQQLSQDGHPYYTAQQGYPVLDQAHLAGLRADGDAEEYQRQQQQQMLDGGYHQVDGPDLLDLSQEVPGVLGVGALTGQSPEAAMIKYESPLPLE